MEANGLKLHTIKSKLEEPKPLSINSLDDIKTYIKKDALVVAYLDYKVFVCRYNNKAFEFYENHTLDLKYIQKIRIFNEYEEFLAWRSGNGLKGRYRKDGDGDEIYVVDSEQVLFGTDKEDKGNGFTRLFEKRGTEIILPFTGLDVKDKAEGKRVFLQTRNYIGCNEAGQATYVDCRFMEFINNGTPLK
jgi:CRISPR-associated protein (TIGR03984 family)